MVTERPQTLFVRQLGVGFTQRNGVRVVVGEVDLELRPGKILGLAGESGCGKSTLGLAGLGFKVPGSRRVSGTALLGDADLWSLGRRDLERIWGGRVAYLPQNAATALNPAIKIGPQLKETLRQHLGLRGQALQQRAIELLERVGLPDPPFALERYPHQFSGGQQQRIALAVVLSCDPEILVLDEPTTGLDVTTQGRINDLIFQLVSDTGTSTLYISHNLALLATICDELAIMYGGQIVERGEACEIYDEPRHPYTAALIRAVPNIHCDQRPRGLPGLPPQQVIDDRCCFSDRCEFHSKVCDQRIELRWSTPDRAVRCARAADLSLVVHSEQAPPRQFKALEPAEKVSLQVRELSCTFKHHGHEVVALDRIGFSVRAGTILGVAGESGSGKSTLLKCIVGLQSPSAGEILFNGLPLAASLRKRDAWARRLIQLIFQNPDESLNPRHTVKQTIERPVKLFQPALSSSERRHLLDELIDDVRLPPSVLESRPSELSGGQRQRVAIARALAGDPEILLCDEVTSALDVSVQAAIVELLADLCERRSTTLLFVTHDLGLLRSLADSVIILQSGRIREEGATRDIYAHPRDAYTRSLLDAVPDPGARLNHRRADDLAESARVLR